MPSSDIAKIVIATEFWEDSDIKEIISVFSTKFEVEEQNIQRWEAGALLDPALTIAIIWIGRELASGFLNAMGADIWNSLKEKIMKKASDKKFPGLRLKIKNKDQSVSFDLRTSDPKLIEKGMDLMQSALDKLDDNRNDFYFDPKSELWVKETDGKIVKYIEGISTAADSPVEKEGKRIVFTENMLPEIAKNQVGLPLTMNHKSRPIGRITEAWVDGKLVRFKAGIFEGLTPDEEKELEGLKGVSMEFTHSGFKKGEPSNDNQDNT